jgi:hypothetical protein
MEDDMKEVVPSPTSAGSYDHYQSYSTVPSLNATQGSPTAASYSLTAYPSEPPLCVLTAPTGFHQSMNQFSNSNNPLTSCIQYQYIYCKFLNTLSLSPSHTHTLSSRTQELRVTNWQTDWPKRLQRMASN